MKKRRSWSDAEKYLNKTFNDLTILEIEKPYKSRSLTLCSCKCGRKSRPTLKAVVKGYSQSCGCRRVTSNQAKGFNKHPLLNTWRGMKMRCNEKNRHKNPKYAPYASKNIQLCEEWRKNFLVFKKWALENGWEKGLEIDRINPYGNYEPSNCRFLTDKAQADNKANTIWLTAFGETKTLTQWVNDPRCVVGAHTLYGRVGVGKRKKNLTEKEMEAALTTRKFKSGPKKKSQ